MPAWWDKFRKSARGYGKAYNEIASKDQFPELGKVVDAAYNLKNYLTQPSGRNSSGKRGHEGSYGPNHAGGRGSYGSNW